MIVILDTNAVVAAAMSRRGASSKLLSLFANGRFDIALTLPVYLEYVDVLQRESVRARGVSPEIGKELCEDLAATAKGHVVHFVWRPWLRSADDDMVLEAAAASGSRCIVTYNVKNFRGFGDEEAFGIEIVMPQALIEVLEESSK